LLPSGTQQAANAVIQRPGSCPENVLGVVDVFQVPHHGDGVAPQLTWALAPTVAVLNNGAHKGGKAEGFAVVKNTPGLHAIWQLHRRLDTDAEHSASDRLTANLTEEGDAAHWIRATVQADGSRYTIVNARNGYSATYSAK